MAQIHLVGGEKGGVGKSLVARLLAQYLIDRELPFLGFDSDRSHGALLRFYQGYASPVLVDSYESLDRIIENAAEAPERRILVDLAAQTHEQLARWMDASGVLELAGELDLKLRYWHVMDAGRESVDLLRALLDRFEDRLGWVVVQNEVRGDGFDLLAASGERERAVALGAKVITVRRLQDAIVRKIDARSASFWAARRQGDAHGLGLMERQRLKTWLAHAYGELDKAEV
jgi:hypothetical protein